MRAAFYLLFISLSLISAEMPWEIPSLPEDSDEDINRSEFECYARCFNVGPSPNKESSNNITKVCERKVTDMRLLRVGNTRMYISNALKTWFQAYQFCRKFGMNLVPITSPVTDSALSRLITKHAQGGEGFWIGATDMATSKEGTWYWLFGGYEFEKDKISVKFVGGSGRCAEMRVIEKSDNTNNKEAEYAKADCTSRKRFVCSFPLACIVPAANTTSNS